MTDLDTDVLVVGSGPAGSAAALALATYGVRTTVITKYGRLADTPRAHITNQRTMEALRDLDRPSGSTVSRPAATCHPTRCPVGLRNCVARPRGWCRGALA